MRTSLLAIVVLCFSATLHGQGYINFDNTGSSAENRVYIDEWLNPAALVPGGTQFRVALYFARTEDGESALVQVGNAEGFIGTPNERYGVFLGGERIVFPTIAGGSGLFQVKGWEAAYGSTYKEAAANPAARRGTSPAFVTDTRHPDSTEPNPNIVNGSQFGGRPFRGFVIAVPEPSTVVLALVGVVTIGLVLRCRRA
jgi:hypothetical protein